MGHARICEKRTGGVNKSPKNGTAPILGGTRGYGKTHQRGEQFNEKHWYTNTVRHARICEKRTRGVKKSPKNISTPIPGGTPGYGKTQQRGEQFTEKR